MFHLFTDFTTRYQKGILFDNTQLSFILAQNNQFSKEFIINFPIFHISIKSAKKHIFLKVQNVRKTTFITF